MRVTLWAAQILLAIAFVASGLAKLSMPMAELTHRLGWPGDFAASLVRGIGLAEVAGAVGLVVPALTRIRPNLTPLAAACLMLLMVCATMFHLARAEGQAVAITVALGALAAFVAWGRWMAAPIAPR
jgi:uncharacterized membrane protein YphA (DoxX/SURF4 family)